MAGRTTNVKEELAKKAEVTKGETKLTKSMSNAGRIFADSRYLYVRLEVFLEKTKSYLRLWGIEWANFGKYAVLNELEAKSLIETRGSLKYQRWIMSIWYCIRFNVM